MFYNIAHISAGASTKYSIVGNVCEHDECSQIKYVKLR